MTTSRLAAAFLEAQAKGGFIEPPSARYALGLDDAYRVGAEVARRRLQQGWRFRGWKVGFTNREIWSRWGLDRPIVAPVYRETLFHVPAGPGSEPHLCVPLGTRAAPRIEAEVVFGVAGAESPDWVALGAELVDCHYDGWRLHPADAVADFGLHAGLVVGPRVALGVEMADSLARMGVSLYANGERLASGTGRAVLGGPTKVLAALNQSLKARTDGYGFPAREAPGGPPGYLVSTGTLTPLVEARLGMRYEVKAGLLPSFSFELAP